MERGLQIGVSCSLPIDVQKRIRLCNLLALWGTAIMAPWFVVELLFGDTRNYPSEVGSLVGFAAVLILNASRAHRFARLLLIGIANACVLAGALLYERSAGGTLPFFALVALPLLLFGPRDRLMVFLGAALPVLLFIACVSGAAAGFFAIQPMPTPRWYLGANIVSAFAIAFVVPFFFYRANVRAEASLERMGREKLKRVIDTNLIGVVRGRLSGRIEEANDTFLSLLGYTRPDLVTGALDLKTIAPLDPPDVSCACALAAVSGRGVTSVYERRCLRKDGASVPVLIGVAFLDDTDDEVVGFVLDLSAQKSVEAQNAKLRESEEALRLRDLFNSIASHELKTPLTALLLNLTTLRKRLDKDPPASTALRVQLDRCEASATRMGELIHTLLDVAQIHDGKLRLSVHEMDLVEAVRRIVGGFEGQRPTGAQPIEVHAEGAVTAKLDALRFDQVVTNLLSNAIKYGAGKPIEVRIARDGSADVARLEVIDHGPGIDPRMTQRIFEPFQRAVSTDEPIPGLGLGLYVVKMIVEEHGGRVKVESQVGQGSRFIVELPRVPAAPSLVA
jgi:PAS domain S-box-containing protein